MLEAFSAQLLPGTSTLMKRAAYYLFVPWICLQLEEKKTSSDLMSQNVRRAEIQLIHALLDTDDQDGLLGKEAKDKLKRMPSSIYWTGVGVWGLRLFQGSQESYYRSLDGFYLSGESTPDGFEGDGREGPDWRNWHPGLPRHPDGFPRQAQLALEREHAEYLADRIRHNTPGTLLAWLVDQQEPWDEEFDFPWEHPRLHDMPDPIQELLLHARNFSQAMHGAALLYNLLLAEASKDEPRLDFYESALAQWAEEVREREDELAIWDRPRFWDLIRIGNPRVPRSTRTFVDSWLNIATPRGSAAGIRRRADAATLIRNRESALKRNRARLTNQRALEKWSGAAWANPMNFRWTAGQSIVLDILRGLERDPSHA